MLIILLYHTDNEPYIKKNEMASPTHDKRTPVRHSVRLQNAAKYNETETIPKDDEKKVILSFIINILSNIPISFVKISIVTIVSHCITYNKMLISLIILMKCLINRRKQSCRKKKKKY